MPNHPTPEPEQEPTVLELLLARIDEHCRLLSLELDAVRAVTEQLEPDRAQSCRTAVILAKTGFDEIRLRARARPLDEPEPS